MSKSSEVSYLREVNKAPSRRLPSPAAIQAVHSVAAKGLKELFQGMFDAIDDSLFELANNARSNNEQNRFFETMREVRIKRRSIEEAFFQSIQGQFEPSSVLQPQDHEQKNEPSVENLSLVGNSDMEQNVAITSMASKAGANYQGQLLEIQRRVAHLYGATNPDTITSPIDPIRVSETFLKSITSLEIELKEQLLILKQFDRFVMSRLEETLAGTIAALDEQGAEFSTSKPSVSQGHPTHRGDESASSSKNVLPALQALLEKQRQLGTSRTTQTATQAIPAHQLVMMLNTIQNQILSQAQQFSEQSLLDIRSAVQSQVKSESARISELDEDLINLVAMLFEFILDDYNLAPSMQVLISRLQIPVLKVVIQDKSFFNSSRHPARNLLNTLAKAGIGWSEQQDKSRDALYLKIQEIVHRVLDEFEGNIELFSQLSINFEDFLLKEERRASIVEQRTREAEEGRIRTKRAHKKVEETLSKQILSAHHAIPEVIIDTLKNGWSRVMFLAYLKDADEHQWQNAIDVSKELIWCLQPLTAAKDRQRWITVVPKLLKDLEAGLLNVSYNSSNLKETIEQIKSELTGSFKESSYTQQATTSIKREKASRLLENSIRKAHSGDSPNSDKKSAPSPSLETENKLLSKLSAGQWVEFELMNGVKHRCKLSAHIQEADCYIFVNRMGLKPIEKTRQELLEDLASKRVVLLEQGLIIDRALNAIATNLRNANKS